MIEHPRFQSARRVIVHLRNRGNLSHRVAFASGLSVICAAFAASALAQAPAQAAAPSLQPYTAPDQSAQAGVPPGWKVTKGGQTVVIMSGPNGETINLGSTFVVRNAPFQLGQKGTNGIDLSMPNSAPLDQKFTMLEQWSASMANAGDPQVKIASSAPIPLSIPNVQCGRLAGTVNTATGNQAFGVLICSLPLDTGGAYKVMFKLAQAPPAIAAQEKALAGAVFASYRVQPAQLKLKLGPHFPPPPPPPSATGSGGGMNQQTINAMRGADVSSTCMDLGVIREEPNWQLPQECGGRGPNP
jgi:hypothetical protein